MCRLENQPLNNCVWETNICMLIPRRYLYTNKIAVFTIEMEVGSKAILNETS